MLFTEPLFLFYFLPFVLFVHRLAVSKTSGRYGNWARLVILFSTLLFYGLESPWWLLPLGLSICIDYSIASCLCRTQNPVLRKMLVALSVIQLISILSFFKYWNFFGRILTAAFPKMASFYPEITLGDHALPLPAGISFYIFESLSFVIDVYRREVTVPKNPLKFLAFIMMFPRFIAGPIVRYRDMEKQFDRYHGMRIEKGLFLFASGFFLKTCFADQFAVFSDLAFSRFESIGFWNAWIGVFAYTLQIYFDFSGYSLMAIGIGHCLGFQFCTNFNRPYLALSLQEFWHKWHISLSTWLRDYLYIPLGGSRKGKARTYLNLFLTMAIGGLWHGAATGYVVWGMWHGTILCLERIGNFPTRLLGRPLAQVCTLTVVMIGWVFFKASGLPHAFTILNAMFLPNLANAACDWEFILRFPLSIALSLIGIYYCFVLERQIDYEKLNSIDYFSLKRRLIAIGQLVMGILIAVSGNKLPFLYFQF